MKKIFILVFIFGLVVGYFVSIYTFEDSPIYAKTVIPIVAASDDVGLTGNITLNLIPGTGRILFDSNPSIDTDMQYSMMVATAYAEDYTHKTLSLSDLIIDLDIPIEVLGGDSAGAPITVGIIALLENKTINSSILLTGTISPDGTIRRVGEIREKTQAARDAGYELILVPTGQSRFWRQNYTLEEYMNNTIKVKEVSNIAQAISIMFIN